MLGLEWDYWTSIKLKPLPLFTTTTTVLLRPSCGLYVLYLSSYIVNCCIYSRCETFRYAYVNKNRSMFRNSLSEVDYAKNVLEHPMPHRATALSKF